MINTNEITIFTRLVIAYDVDVGVIDSDGVIDLVDVLVVDTDLVDVLVTDTNLVDVLVDDTDGLYK